MVLSDTLKTSSQGGAFQVRSSSGPLGSVSKVQDIFSEMDFLATEYNSKSLECFGYHLDNPDQQFERGLVLGSFLDSLWFLQGAMSTQMG